MQPPEGMSPTISIMVPARNEEGCLARCLESLVSQAGVRFEVIVIDDDSTDRTREIAESFSGVRVVGSPQLEHNWTGKNNAAFAGASQARGIWFLFTDADTVHRPGSLARALGEAQKYGASLLSYSPEQEVSSFWEKAVMPVIFGELAATYSSDAVSDPASPAAAANGQYLLVSREAYDAVGGHAVVAASLLEDVELARAVKRSARKIYFRYGGDAVRTRMYRSFAQLKEGWTKNLVLLFPSSMTLAGLRLAEFLLIASNAIAVAVLAARGQWASVVAPVVIAIILYSRFLARIRRAHFSWDANVFSILGLPLFSYMLLLSKVRHKSGNVTWKGRSYGLCGADTPVREGLNVQGGGQKCPPHISRQGSVV
jgi:glycosyltransferase involved in cell wall biosynthesis